MLTSGSLLGTWDQYVDFSQHPLQTLDWQRGGNCAWRFLLHCLKPCSSALKTLRLAQLLDGYYAIGLPVRALPNCAVSTLPAGERLRLVSG